VRKYRQTFLRVSADGEETTQSATLMVETNRTLPVVAYTHSHILPIDLGTPCSHGRTIS
jgi:hypothetical protein